MGWAFVVWLVIDTASFCLDGNCVSSYVTISLIWDVLLGETYYSGNSVFFFQYNIREKKYWEG